MNADDAGLEEFMAMFRTLGPTQRALAKQLLAVSVNAPPEPLNRLAQAVTTMTPLQAMDASAEFIGAGGAT